MFKKIIKYLHTRYVQGGGSKNDTVQVTLTRQQIRLCTLLLRNNYPVHVSNWNPEKLEEVQQSFLDTINIFNKVMNDGK